MRRCAASRRQAKSSPCPPPPGQLTGSDRLPGSTSIVRMRHPAGRVSLGEFGSVVVRRARFEQCRAAPATPGSAAAWIERRLAFARGGYSGLLVDRRRGSRCFKLLIKMAEEAVMSELVSPPQNSLLAGKIQGISRVGRLLRHWTPVNAPQYRSLVEQIPCVMKQRIQKTSRECDRRIREVSMRIRERACCTQTDLPSYLPDRGTTVLTDRRPSSLESGER